MPENPVRQTAGLRFELHSVPIAPGECKSAEYLPWRVRPAPPPACSLSIAESEGLLWMQPHLADKACRWTRLGGPEPGALGFQFTRRHFATALALVSLRGDVFINGVPALGMSLLEPKDTILLSDPRLMFFVTERFRPVVGRPTPEFLGRKCPACNLVFEPDTALVSCACGAAYHNETVESHPQLPEKERLNCLTRLGKCPNCDRDLTTEEYLVWDPRADG